MLAVSFSFVVFSPSHAESAAQPKLRTEVLRVVTSNGIHAFTVEIAATERQREAGLMFRAMPAEGEGMLFVNNNGEPARVLSMWMKNTPATLDMLFIESTGRIASMKENAQPYSLEPISSGVPVSAVLEVAAGTVKKRGIRIGDTVESSHFCAKSPCSTTN